MQVSPGTDGITMQLDQGETFEGTLINHDGQPVKRQWVTEEVINVAVIRDQLGKVFQITGLDSTEESRNLALLRGIHVGARCTNHFKRLALGLVQKQLKLDHVALARGEPPLDFADRVASNTHNAHDVRSITELYLDVRYGDGGDTAIDKLRQAVRRFRLQPA